MSGIYDKIHEIANSNALTIKQIEKGANVANGTIGKWRNKTPRVDKLKAVADFLGVSIDALVKES